MRKSTRLIILEIFQIKRVKKRKNEKIVNLI